MQKKSANKIQDISSWFKVYVDGESAIKLVEELRSEGFKVTPNLKSYPTSIEQVADLTSAQGYLDEFRVNAIWNTGVYGAGVSVVDS